ncbi:MAG: hypothetical protein Q8S84_01810 [bacterium]|nr:hypothetical protein [bacterium]MDP3380295.1 hypothetical protein [bacterium]
MFSINIKSLFNVSLIIFSNNHSHHLENSMNSIFFIHVLFEIFFRSTLSLFQMYLESSSICIELSLNTIHQNVG